MPLVGLGSALVDFLISFGLLLAIMGWYGFWPHWQALWLLPYLLLASCTGLAVGLWFAAWIVHFRDIANILGFIVRFWMYACPVVYAISFVPEKWRSLYFLNPMVTVVQGSRWALLNAGENPAWHLLLSFALVLPMLISGAYYYRRTERSIVDIA